MKRMFFRILLSVAYFYIFSASATPVTISYVVEKLPSNPEVLKVHVDLTDKHASTQMILRGSGMGIASQVQEMICDGKPIPEDKPGVWHIASDCQKLSWQIPLHKSGTDLASAQHSIKLNHFILLSEAASLPRLQNIAGLPI